MSLTSELKDTNSPIYQYMKERFPNIRPILADWTRQLAGASTVCPTNTTAYPWSIIGMAFDYRMRYYFGITPSIDLAAFKGAIGILGFHPSIIDNNSGARGNATETIRVAIESIVTKTSKKSQNSLRFSLASLFTEFFTSLEAVLASTHPVGRRLDEAEEGLLARNCYILALLEAVYRAGLVAASPLFFEPKITLNNLLSAVEDQWVDDLCALSWMFYDRYSDLLSLPIISNPSFVGSTDVRGADADIIINGALIDTKTTINSQKRSRWLRQLLGYVLLDYSDQHRIHTVGFYLARQGVLLKWPLAELIPILAGGNVSLNKLRLEFAFVAKHRQSLASCQKYLQQKKLEPLSKESLSVVLLRNVAGLGVQGQLVHVAKGSARDFLIPHKLAQVVSSTKKLDKYPEQTQSENIAQAASHAKETASTLEGLTIIIPKRTRKSGALFGFVTAKDIATTLLVQYNIAIDPDSLMPRVPIRELGKTHMLAYLYPGILVVFQVEVVPEQQAFD